MTNFGNHWFTENHKVREEEKYIHIFYKSYHSISDEERAVVRKLLQLDLMYGQLYQNPDLWMKLSKSKTQSYPFSPADAASYAKEAG